jgi:membrane fusion protein (multidrug efflux system)
VIEVIPNGLLIPQRCVQELQGNYNVFVVTEDNQVEFRSIEVGAAYKTSYLVVNTGLEAGEKVIFEGLQMVKSGITVNPVVKEISFSESQN